MRTQENAHKKLQERKIRTAEELRNRRPKLINMKIQAVSKLESTGKMYEFRCESSKSAVEYETSEDKL
jgi:hypothetical protein